MSPLEGFPPEDFKADISHIEKKSVSLTRPVRLGLPPTLEATELTELMDELLGL